MHATITRRKGDGVYELNAKVPHVAIHGHSGCDKDDKGNLIEGAMIWVVVATADKKEGLWSAQEDLQEGRIDIVDGKFTFNKISQAA